MPWWQKKKVFVPREGSRTERCFTLFFLSSSLGLVRMGEKKWEPLWEEARAKGEDNRFGIKGCGREGFKEIVFHLFWLQLSFQCLSGFFFFLFLHAINNVFVSCFAITGMPFVFRVVFGFSSRVESWVFQRPLRLSQQNYTFLESAS